MDVIANSPSFVPAWTGSGQPSLASTSFLASVPILLCAVGLLSVEIRRKGGPCIPGFGDAVRKYMPELVCLTTMAAFVAVILHRAQNIGFAPTSPVFDDIMKKEWPMLMTSDTLFVLQGLIRVIVLLSVAFRTGTDASALAGEAALFLLLARICFLTLFAMSPSDVYHIDGPLGGPVSVVVEALSVPLLIFLSRGILHQKTRDMLAIICCTALAVWIACHNCFGLASSEAAHLDALFSLVQLLDFCSACAILAKSVSAAGNQKGQNLNESFMYLMLPVQQFLPWYFFLTGLAPWLDAVPALVRNGHPFEMLWAIDGIQIGMYIFAGAIYLASSVDDAPAVVDMNPLMPIDV